MYVTIAVHYVANDNRVLRRGDFKVNTAEYKRNELQEVVRVANQFVWQIQKETTRPIIEKVLYNGKDITKYVKK